MPVAPQDWQHYIVTGPNRGLIEHIRQKGQSPKFDRLAAKVFNLQNEGRSYRWIARELEISKNTVMSIVK